LYGLKTMLYGTLLPGPAIAASAPDLLRRLVAAGHELGLHGFDHVFWQDRLGQLSAAAIQAEIRRAQAVHQEILGYRALAFAAPGWQCTPAALTALAAERFYYLSNTRGQSPYFPAAHGRIWPLLEIPTTLPTLDELLGLDGRRGGDFNREILTALRPGHTHVLTIHAEVEGRRYLQDFTALLAEAQAQGVRWLRLIDYATELWQHWQQLPRQEMAPGTLPGRAGTVTCQVPGETPL
ncbi:MAG: polysaccharide deacetylase family protein, partial [Desulfobacca sp.]|uniref:polysaccharide deacetylase family protein n=1 Tax=Desulfobacca sp. TaxID=2067990 RepID=UPI00404A9F20